MDKMRLAIIQEGNTNSKSKIKNKRKIVHQIKWCAERNENADPTPLYVALCSKNPNSSESIPSCHAISATKTKTATKLGTKTNHFNFGEFVVSSHAS